MPLIINNKLDVPVLVILDSSSHRARLVLPHTTLECHYNEEDLLSLQNSRVQAQSSLKGY